MLNPYFAKKLFLLAEHIRGEHIQQYLNSLEKSQWYSPSDLKELQLEKLKMLLAHAYQNVPWYRNKFRERNITPDDIITIEDLKLLPILTKFELRHHMKDLLAQGYNGRMSIAKTSGSTGISMKFSKDRKSSGFGRAAMYRGHRWYGVDIGDKEAKLCWVPLNFPKKNVYAFEDFLLNRFRQKSFELNETVLQDFYNKIKRRKPRYLMGFPSMAYQFAQFLKERKINSEIGLKIIKVTSETLYDYQRETIKEVFQCPVVNEYGAAETGLMGFECPKHRIHMMSECVILEEDDNDDLGDGSREFIVSDLNNYTLPIIRYKLGDRGRLSNETCECGRGLPLIESIEGRTSDIAYTANMQRVHSSIFSYILKEVHKSVGGIQQLKVYQNRIGYLTLEIVRDSLFTNNTELYLRNFISQYFDRNTIVDVEYVDDIKRDQSGKLRYFESNVSLHNHEVQLRNSHA